MVNIKQLQVTIEFLEKVKFIEEPEIAFYKIIYKRLKNLLCLTSASSCDNCEYINTCIYYYISSEDFNVIDCIPVIIKRPLLSRKNYKPKEQFKFTLLFLGRSTLHIDFFVYIIRELEYYGLFKQYKFIIKDIKIESVCIEKIDGIIKGLKVFTPFKAEGNLFENEQEKISKLNMQHDIFDIKLDNCNIMHQLILKDIQFKNIINIQGKKINYSGKIGYLFFEKKTTINKFLKLIYLIGLGDLYGLGGGRFEFISG